MKKWFKSIIVLCMTILLLGCNVVAAFAEDLYIVYNDPNGFPKQAKYMGKHHSDDYTIKYVRSSSDFIKTWNAAANGSKEYDNLIIMLHGGVENGIGGLYFSNEDLWNSYSQLNYFGANLSGNILLLSCQGGTGGTDSVAYNLSKRSGSFVVAAKNSAVNYNWLFNKNPDLDNKSSGSWVRISAVRGRTYKCVTLGTSWKFSYLN